LIEHHGVIIWYIQQSPDVFLALSINLQELRLSMAQLHYTLVRALVIYHILGAPVQNCSWQDAGTWGEIIDEFAISKVFACMPIFLTALHV
jgi:hypothetical protein